MREGRLWALSGPTGSGWEQKGTSGADNEGKRTFVVAGRAAVSDPSRSPDRQSGDPGTRRSAPPGSGAFAPILLIHLPRLASRKRTKPLTVAITKDEPRQRSARAKAAANLHLDYIFSFSTNFLGKHSTALPPAQRRSHVKPPLLGAVSDVGGLRPNAGVAARRRNPRIPCVLAFMPKQKAKKRGRWSINWVNMRWP
jgi:hypothetical protein